MEERLQKIISRAGIASRREAENLIEEGLVTVNGQVVTELGSSADIEKDHIKVKGKLLSLPQPVYILLYKPKGVVSSVTDPEGRPVVVDLLQGIKARVYPVGRLDFNTEGALLLTNDGDLANRMLSPRTKCPKTYLVKVAHGPSPETLGRLQRGITVDGTRYGQCKIEVVKATGNSWLKVTLFEGKNQQIRKMFAEVGHPVSKLKRIAFSFLTIGDLEPGQWRHLGENEIDRLRDGGFSPKAPLDISRYLQEYGIRVTGRDLLSLEAYSRENRDPGMDRRRIAARQAGYGDPRPGRSGGKWTKTGSGKRSGSGRDDRNDRRGSADRERPSDREDNRGARRGYQGGTQSEGRDRNDRRGFEDRNRDNRRGFEGRGRDDNRGAEGRGRDRDDRRNLESRGRDDRRGPQGRGQDRDDRRNFESRGRDDRRGPQGRGQDRDDRRSFESRGRDDRRGPQGRGQDRDDRRSFESRGRDDRRGPQGRGQDRDDRRSPAGRGRGDDRPGSRGRDRDDRSGSRAAGSKPGFKRREDGDGRTRGDKEGRFEKRGEGGESRGTRSGSKSGESRGPRSGGKTGESRGPRSGSKSGESRGPRSGGKGGKFAGKDKRGAFGGKPGKGKPFGKGRGMKKSSGKRGR